MKRNLWIGLVLWGSMLLGTGWLLAQPHHRGQAAPLAQPTPFPTPTPREDGAIVYIVQPEDTLWRIAAISGVPIEELRALNGLRSDVVTPGQPLILGYAVPGATPTPAETGPTPTPLLPTPTPIPQTGVICVFLFEDRNGNAIFDEGEARLSGGAVSLQRRDGTALTDTTRAEEAVCFEDLPPGDYSVAMGVPEGMNPTTATNRPLRLEEGDTLYVAFGAQYTRADVGLLAQGGGDAGRGSLLMAVAGGGLVLAGLALGWYAWRGRRPSYLQHP